MLWEDSSAQNSLGEGNIQECCASLPQLWSLSIQTILLSPIRGASVGAQILMALLLGQGPLEFSLSARKDSRGEFILDNPASKSVLTFYLNLVLAAHPAKSLNCLHYSKSLGSCACITQRGPICNIHLLTKLSVSKFQALHLYCTDSYGTDMLLFLKRK